MSTAQIIWKEKKGNSFYDKVQKSSENWRPALLYPYTGNTCVEEDTQDNCGYQTCYTSTLATTISTHQYTKAREVH
jgi:hypothetical protein